MTTHDIELPPLPTIDVMGKSKPQVWFTALEVDDLRRAAIEADRQRRQSEAEEVCAEAYQVVGSLLSDLGIFETDHAKKILDNLSQAKMVHKDVLPWPSFDRKRRGEPVAWIQRSYLNLIRESNVALHNVVVRGSILDGDGDVVPLFTAPQPAEPVKSHLKVSYDAHGDCLYVVCDSNEPADAEEDDKGILYRRAISDGRLVGITIMNFMGPHAESRYGKGAP